MQGRRQDRSNQGDWAGRNRSIPAGEGLDACNPFNFSTQSPRAHVRQRVCFDLLPCLPSSTSLHIPGSQASEAKLTKSPHPSSYGFIPP